MHLSLQVHCCMIELSDLYRISLNVRGTKFLQIANLLNIREFYFCGCWDRIDIVDHSVPENLCN